MKKLIVSSAVVAVLSTSAFASNVGCGLGWAVFGDNPNSILGELFKMTTNQSTSSQAFGVTSGTSGCKQPRNLFVSNETHQFVNDNINKLALDISAGRGETLTTLATLLKVEDTASFNTKLQSNFDKIYTSENVTSSDIIDNIVKVAG